MTVKDLENAITEAKNTLRVCSLQFPTITLSEIELKAPYETVKGYMDKHGHSYDKDQSYGWLTLNIQVLKQNKCEGRICISSSIKYEQA